MISSYLSDVVYEDYRDLIEEILEDGISFDYFCAYLEDTNKFIFTWSGKEIGFFTEELKPDGVEIHFMIKPEFRKYSMSAFRYVNNLYKNTKIYTSVFATHKHVCSVLEKIGFTLDKTEENYYLRGGNTYDVFFYEREKL